MRRGAGTDMLEVMADHRCDRPEGCSTCDLFGAIPDSLTPEYLTWVSSIRKDLLTDPLILRLCPDLVLWLLDRTEAVLPPVRDGIVTSPSYNSARASAVAGRVDGVRRPVTGGRR